MNKIINDTVKEMEDINACGLKTENNVEPNAALCMIEVNKMKTEIDMLIAFHTA